MSAADTITVMPTAQQGKSVTLNATAFSDGYLSYFSVFLLVVYIIAILSSLCGLVGNMKIIWILSFCIKRNPFATYILNLAVADFGTLLSELAYDIHEALVFFNPAPHGGFDIIFLFVDVLVFFMHSASLYLLTAISLETVHSVLSPVWDRCHRPGRSSAVVSFLLWILSGLLSGLFLLCHFQGPYCRTIVNIICIVNFLICTPFMIGSSLAVAIAICCTSRRHRPLRLYVAILVTILFFVLFGIPLSVLRLFCNADDLLEGAVESSYLLASFISNINPFIYYFGGRDRKRQPRESWKAVLHRLFKEESEAREELGKGNQQRRVRQR